MTKVSIITRTRNEERWISQCLAAVSEQKFRDFEVIIVDNESSDKTVEKAMQFKVAKLVKCSEYLPGKALNIGIKESSGDYIVCLSGHCIPVNDQWLGNLLKNFEDKSVAGVYGRQEAMDFSSDADKRDLALVFGLDRKVQEKDSFFHNANSMILRRVWDKVPFDEKATNIEDRIWAQRILGMGLRIVYEPDASVYHYHGIHQNGDMERCTNVVRVLESLHSDYEYKSIDIKNLNVVAIVPVKGDVRYLGDKPLLTYTITAALKSKYIKRVIVSTDNSETADIAKKFGAEAPFLRDESLSKEHVDLDQVFSYSLNKIEALKIFPDIVVPLEITFPFRPDGLIDDMVAQLAQSGLDTVIAAKRENRGIWKDRDDEIVQIDEGITPRQFKDPTFIELRGVGCVTHPEFLRKGKVAGEKIGIYEVNNPYSHLEVRSEAEFKMAESLIKGWLK